MNATLILCLVAVMFCNILLGAAGCSTQTESQSSAAAPKPSPRKEVVVRFVAEPANAPKPATGHIVIFKRGQTAFALGDYYYLLRTTDGGQSWQQLLPTPEDEKLFGGKFKEMVVSFSFLTPKRGWMSAERGVWQTEDGGDTWRLIFPSRWKSINFAEEQYGWLSLYKDEDSIQNYVTRDGGETWQICGSASDEQTPGNIHFLTPQLGWGITRRSVEGDEVNGIARTSDGGCHWQQVWTNNDDPDERYKAIYFLSEHEGWLAGESRLYQTADGGRTWKSLPLPTKGTQVTDVYFINSKEGWIIAALKEKADEVVFHTIDDGKAWRQLTGSEIAGSEFPSEWEAGRLLQVLYARTYAR
jgi:photosystem II stability/assembly factor-like uncharacterized protein